MGTYSYTRTLENLETSEDPFTEGLVKALGKVSGKLGMLLFGSKNIEAVNVRQSAFLLVVLCLILCQCTADSAGGHQS